MTVIQYHQPKPTKKTALRVLMLSYQLFIPGLNREWRARAIMRIPERQSKQKA
jgi:hypothetical protein